ncbi:MAG: CvpA family protein [Prevotellaceae bacterium]|jgi:membrane protein required for colicin V production|nr:CvpA family protein [Prevotellaceae bacterium]
MIDLIIIAALAYGIIRGIIKGFVLEVSSFAGVFVAILIARLYYVGFAEHVRVWFDLDVRYARPAAFLVIFSIVVLACHFLAVLIDKFLKIVLLSWLNRLIGAVFGGLKMLVILSILFNVMYAFGNRTGLYPQKSVEKSILFEPVRRIGAVFLPFAET